MSEALLKAFSAAATAFLAAANGVPGPAAAAGTPAPRGRGRPPGSGKKAEAPATNGDDLGGDDLGGDDLGGDDLGGDDLGGAPEAPKGPTKEDVRAALLKLKDATQSATASRELMTKAINDASKQPIIDNIPTEKYEAIINAAKKRIAAAGK